MIQEKCLVSRGVQRNLTFSALSPRSINDNTTVESAVGRGDGNDGCARLRVGRALLETCLVLRQERSACPGKQYFVSREENGGVTVVEAVVFEHILVVVVQRIVHARVGMKKYFFLQL